MVTLKEWNKKCYFCNRPITKWLFTWTNFEDKEKSDEPVCMRNECQNKLSALWSSGSRHLAFNQNIQGSNPCSVTGKEEYMKKQGAAFGILGALIGIGAAYALSTKKVRTTVKNFINDFKDEFLETFNEVEEKVKEKKDELVK